MCLIDNSWSTRVASGRTWQNQSRRGGGAVTALPVWGVIRLRRRFALVAILVVAAVVSWFSVSMARGSESDFAPTLSALEDLPRVPVDQASRPIFDGPHFARYGITVESLDRARILAQTEAGPLYVIPGSNDALCLLLDGGVSCGVVRGREPISIFRGSRDREFVVGGGVWPDLLRGVAIRQRDSGRMVSPRRVPGGFVISAEHRIPRDQFGGVVIEP